jgi:hypothetical protein
MAMALRRAGRLQGPEFSAAVPRGDQGSSPEVLVDDDRGRAARSSAVLASCRSSTATMPDDAPAENRQVQLTVTVEVG